MGRQFCFVFNLKFRDVTCSNISQLTQRYYQFLAWLRKFVEINHINFPHIEVFFILIVFNSIDSARLTENSKHMKNFNIIAIEKKIDEAFGNPSALGLSPVSSCHKNSDNSQKTLMDEGSSAANNEIREQAEYLSLYHA